MGSRGTVGGGSLVDELTLPKSPTRPARRASSPQTRLISRVQSRVDGTRSEHTHKSVSASSAVSDSWLCLTVEGCHACRLSCSPCRAKPSIDLRTRHHVSDHSTGQSAVSQSDMPVTRQQTRRVSRTRRWPKESAPVALGAGVYRSQAFTFWIWSRSHTV